MHSEHYSEIIIPTDELSLRAARLRPTPENVDAILDFFEKIATFAQTLNEQVSRQFPDEPKAASKIPAYHVLSGSTITSKMDMNPGEEAKQFVESEISAFLDELELEEKD